MRPALVTATLLAGTVLSVTPAMGHVAPSATENNRYLKVTLLPDRARVTYTVYFGERPGAGERQRMDRNADGRLDEAEASAFGAELREHLAPRVSVALDGAPARGAWRVADVGLGLPQTAGGSFAVDLVLEAPAGPGQSHTLTVTDGFELPPVGEAELRIEESPGVRAVAAHAPGGSGVKLRYAYRGALGEGGPRSVQVTYVVDEAAASSAATARSAGPTGPPPARARHRRTLWIALGAVGLGLVLMAALGLRRKATTTTGT
jgi:hypothetical protein